MVRVTAGSRWRVELPRGWQPKCGPGVDLLAVAPVSARPVAAHLLLAFEHVPRDMALETLAARSVAHIGAIGRDVRILGERGQGGGVSPDVGLERSTRVVAFDARRGPAEVAQVVAFVAPRHHDGEGRDVAQFVGTCAFDELPRFGDVFAAVIESLAVHPHPSVRADGAS
jgi:hypothetical protein